MKDKFTIERLSENNFDAFIQLFQTVFDTKTKRQFLIQKYDTSYLGTPYQHIGFLAFNQQGEAVSYCGCIPFLFELQGEKFIAAHSCDHMTRSDARGNGLFTKLNHKTDELVKELGISLVFGFPNQNNHPLLVKYGGWKIIDTTKVFTLPIKTIPLASIARRIPVFNQLYDLFISSKIKNKLAHKPVRNKHWQGIIRDNAFYTYKKYSKNYTLDFEHGKVWFKIKGALFIGDIFLDTENDFMPLINELKRFAMLIGVTKIIFITSSNTAIGQLFETILTPQQGNAIGMKILMDNAALDLNQLQFTLGDYDTF